MGYAIETVVGSYSTAATTGAQAYSAASGQSFNIRAFQPNTTATLEAIWGYSALATLSRVRSPRLHDDVVGIESQQFALNASPMVNEYFSQQVYSQDTLIVEDYWTAAPAASNEQTIGMQIYYQDVPGISANYMTFAEVSSKVQSYMGVYVSATGNATVGQWGTGVAINSSQDVFKANSLYALLGYEVNVACTAVSILGTDIGNLQVGGPGSVDPKITRYWFVEQEFANSKPSIPVINSQNKGSTLVQVFTPAASTAVRVTLLFAYLGPIS